MFRFGEDSGPHAPKAIAGAPPEGEPGRKRIAAEALVIYELNLRGFTRLHPQIPETVRGTFAGLAHPASIAHLSALGVTAVEIMPADAFVDERHLAPLGLANAWGYNPVVFGAPDPRLAPGGWAEVRAATDALHAAGMEAILDVVFNHNGESDQFGPTLSFRGLDNATFFRLDPNEPRALRQRRWHAAIAWRSTGRSSSRWRSARCGAGWSAAGSTASASISRSRSGGRDDGFDPRAPFFQALGRRPDRLEGAAHRRALGHRPRRLSARPVRTRLGRVERPLSRRRAPLLARRRRRPRATSRRGSPDRATCSASAPRPRGASISSSPTTASPSPTSSPTPASTTTPTARSNRDGTDANYSWNHGVEGPSADPAIVAARARDQRNLLALLLASRGTPMLAMGAELGFTPGGNNNAYAQDNATRGDPLGKRRRGPRPFREPARALAPAPTPPCRATPFSTGKPFDASGLPDVEWRDAEGPMSQAAWNDPAGPVLVAVFAAPAGDRADRVALAMNRAESGRTCGFPRRARAWRGASSSTRSPGRA